MSLASTLGGELYPAQSLERRVSTHLLKSLPLEEAVSQVEPQQADGHFTDGGARDDEGAFSLQPEVLRPAVQAWIEEADEVSRPRFQRGDVAALVTVAEETGVGEVILSRLASVPLADDVVNLAAEEHVLFVGEAVLAEKVGAGCDQPPKLGADVALAHLGQLPERNRRARALARRMMCSSWE